MVSLRERSQFTPEVIRHRYTVGRLAERSGLAPGQMKLVFERADRGLPNREALGLVEQYAAQWEGGRIPDEWLYLYGGVGTGKTYAATCLATAILEQEIGVIWCSVREILDHLAAPSTAREDYMNTLFTVPALILDDLGSESPNEYAAGILFEIIDRRYKTNRPVIITTNNSPADLKERLRYDRIMDRFREKSRVIVFEGESLRKAR